MGRVSPAPGANSVGGLKNVRGRRQAQLEAEVVAHPPVDRLVAEARPATGDVHPEGPEAALDDARGWDRQVAGVVIQLGSTRAHGHVEHPVVRAASGVGVQVAIEHHLYAVLLDQRHDVAAKAGRDAGARGLPRRVVPGGEAEAGGQGQGAAGEAQLRRVGADGNVRVQHDDCSVPPREAVPALVAERVERLELGCPPFALTSWLPSAGNQADSRMSAAYGPKMSRSSSSGAPSG